MQRNGFSDVQCSIARTVDVIGDLWTPLILRDLFAGLSRFDDIQRNLGVSRKILSGRLRSLTEHGVIERAPYQDNPPRYDYTLTEKGADLAFVLMAMQAWGDRWVFADDGPPVVLRHDRCGAVTLPTPSCATCGEPLSAADVTIENGPTAKTGPGTWVLVERRERARG